MSTSASQRVRASEAKKPEHYRALKAKGRERKRVENRAYAKAHYERNREKRKQQVKAWAESNLERVRLIGRRKAQNRHARKLNQFVEDVDPMVVYARQRVQRAFLSTQRIAAFEHRNVCLHPKATSTVSIQ